MIEKIKSIENLCSGVGVSDEQITEAEKALGLKFPKEYVAYLKEFGKIRFFATEWTGLNAKGYRNVVEATNDEKSVNESFPKGFFVLENLGVDAKMVVVNEKGEVYILQYDRLKLICNTIEEYLDFCIARKNS
ncbi:MAG: SMI1/KNR4 family protein [Treponema sp.]|nr:SMI1/KNR4 family protein [Treponema sp.]